MMELRIAYDGNDLPKFERVGVACGPYVCLCVCYTYQPTMPHAPVCLSVSLSHTHIIIIMIINLVLSLSPSHIITHKPPPSPLLKTMTTDAADEAEPHRGRPLHHDLRRGAPPPHARTGAWVRVGPFRSVCVGGGIVLYVCVAMCVRRSLCALRLLAPPPLPLILPKRTNSPFTSGAA